MAVEKPEAVIQEMDSIWPPTLWTAKADHPNLAQMPPGRPAEDVQVLKDNRFPPDRRQVEKKHHKLGKDGGDGCAGYLQAGEGTNAEDEHRVQNKVDHQADGGDPKGSNRIAGGGENAAQHQIQKGEHNQAAGNHQVNLGVLDNLGAVEMEEGDEGLVEDQAEEAEQHPQDGAHLEGPPGQSGLPPPACRPQGIARR